MKKSELQQIIKEEVRRVLKEFDDEGSGYSYDYKEGDGASPKEIDDTIKFFKKDTFTWNKAGKKDFEQLAIGKNADIKTDQFPTWKKEDFQKVLDAMAYGEKEAGEEIFNNPEIEAALKKIKGYDSIASGKPGDMYIYFRQQQSAIAGAKLLDKLVPGPDYENSIVQDSGMWVIEIES